MTPRIPQTVRGGPRFMCWISSGGGWVKEPSTRSIRRGDKPWRSRTKCPVDTEIVMGCIAVVPWYPAPGHGTRAASVASARGFCLIFEARHSIIVLWSPDPRTTWKFFFRIVCDRKQHLLPVNMVQGIPLFQAYETEYANSTNP